MSASGFARRASWLAAFTTVVALPTSVWADVRMETKTVSQGLMGFGDGTTTSVLTVAGDKSCATEEFTYTGRFKTFAGKKPKKTSTIVRLDKELIWNVEAEKKQYTEMTFAEIRELMQKGMAEAEAQAARAEANGAGSPQDANLTFTVDVKKTGEKQDVNGFPCERVIISAVGKPESPQSDSVNAEVRIVLDQWMTEKVPGEREMAEYGQAYAAKMGLDAQLASLAPMARAMYGKGIQELGEKLKEVRGTPIRSTFTIEGPPPSAQQTAERKQAVEDMKKTSAERDKQEKGQDVADAASIGSAAAQGQDVKGGVGGFLGRKLGNMMAKKAEKSAMKSAETEPGPLFKVVTDVVSVSSAPAAAGTFDVPSGYKKVERKNP